MPIDAGRWAAVKEHFAELLDVPTAVRDSRLEAIDDAMVRDEVRALLAAEAAAGARFDCAPLLRPLADEPPVDLRLPNNRIGNWRIERLIGEGGMGAVYEAVRDDAGFSKRVAIKMIARHQADAALVERFEAERRILARLEHRNIAALLDGGVDAAGRPWFALEYVEGQRIDQWCVSQGLDLRARVLLFRQACTAVHYAHEHLVVHRDIKPANMLVAQDGTLKLLDFGIAKLTDDSANPLTLVGASPMTAAYASPEQRAGKPVTTGTDIYSLGVVLHELLTGVRPELSAGSDSTPIRPSRRLTTTAGEDGSPAATAQRATRRLLEGDLDSILLMALRPESARRYASAREFGDDLQRWLDGRTVRAQPDTLGYRTRSFVRRNRVAVAGVAAGVLAMVAATVVSVQQARVARLERDRARMEQVRTQRVSSFFQQVMTQAVPREAGRGVTVVDAVDRAVAVLDTAFSREPDLRAAVQLSIGSTLQNLGRHERARPLLQSAYDHFRRHDGPVPSRDQTDALWDLAALAQQDGRLADAESLYTHAASLYARAPGYRPNDRVSALIRIAGVRLDAGDLRGAVAAYDSTIPELQLLQRSDSIDRAAHLASRGVALATLGDFPRARADFAASLALNERLLGADNFAVGAVLQPYAGVMMFTGQLVAAESLARRSLRIAQQAYGAGTPNTISAARMLGTVLVAADRCADAIRVFSDILASRGPELPDSDPSVGYALAHRGYCRARTGEVASGMRDAREGLALSQRELGADHYATHMAESLAGAAIGWGPAAGASEAGRLLRAGAEGLRRTLDPSHPRVRDADARLAEFRRRTATR